ncbi:hypothetical protein HanXRQr2_Chr14g0640351 [Helianthus annuus]|uniref:Uncharacterized protein n=1 Tax=Helianthus annuus TaxID=4232 RepID=A0A9K3H7D7_HELAN|nr:hypothetical protein HanXRQr2_Chr14g0640351 [Helianthus annuus]
MLDSHNGILLPCQNKRKVTLTCFYSVHHLMGLQDSEPGPTCESLCSLIASPRPLNLRSP